MYMSGEQARSEIGMSWVEVDCGGFLLCYFQFNSVLSSY